MFRKNTLILAGTVIFISFGSLIVLGQEKNVQLKEKPITIQMTERSLYTVFNRLINKYDIAIGFEESILDRNHRDYHFETNVPTEKWMPEYGGEKEVLSPTRALGYEHLFTLNFRDAKLEVVMDEIVKQMKNYDWEINDGVVNIFPIRGRDTRLEKLLGTKVRDFAVGMGAHVGSVQAQLMLFLPEFKAFLAENNLGAETGRPGSVFEDRLLPDGMRFANLTFRELLNAITKSKRGGWILQIKTEKDKPSTEVVEILI